GSGADDEAADGRAFREAARNAHCETRPGPGGTAAGGIWVRNDEDVAEARRHMAQYQRARGERVRAETAQARRDGTAETFSGIARAQPLRVAVILVAIALLLGLMALPAILIGL